MNRRADLWSRIIADMPRFLWGLALMPPIALTGSTAILAAETAIAALFMILAGKRVKILPNLVLIASVVAFSLLSPRGRILAEWGPVRITLDALTDGLRRGLTIMSLVFVSGFSVSPSLRLPGRFGDLLAGVFSSFTRLMEGRKDFDRKDWAGSVDRILFTVYDPDAPDADAASLAAPIRTSLPRGLAFLGCATAALCWAAALWACLASRA